MIQKPISTRIAHLDPVRDHQEIVFLLACYLFPWDIQKSLEFALFRTYAVPSISSLLARSGEFRNRPRKRYDDTDIVMSSLIENGYDSEAGRRVLRRMNQMHGSYLITNDDFLYVLSTFVFEPIRWIERYGWRSFTSAEKLAWFTFFREVGRRMNITDLPSDVTTFEQFNVAYEREHFQFAQTNSETGLVTVDLLLSFYLPKFLWRIARPGAYALMDDPLLNAMHFPRPSPLLRSLLTGALRTRGRVLRWLPQRQKPVLRTKQKRPTYPEGYVIEEIGTFPRRPTK